MRNRKVRYRDNSCPEFTKSHAIYLRHLFNIIHLLLGLPIDLSQIFSPKHFHLCLIIYFSLHSTSRNATIAICHRLPLFWQNVLCLTVTQAHCRGSNFPLAAVTSLGIHCYLPFSFCTSRLKKSRLCHSQSKTSPSRDRRDIYFFIVDKVFRASVSLSRPAERFPATRSIRKACSA